MSRVAVCHLVKQWGTVKAVNRLSFSVPAGSLTVLLGPSGCGKSTVLRLVAGLEAATSGSIFIGGDEVTHLDPAARGVSMVFQSYALFPHLNVRENILFGLKVRRISFKERESRLKAAAHMVGLTGLLNRKPAQLSGGQRQRVALARSIVSRRRVCLMDEPLSNLDAKLRAEMREEIRALQQRLGLTMVYVTHDQVEAMTMADQVVLLKNGRIVQMGTPHQLYEHPKTTFAAQFLGSPPMNLLKIEKIENSSAVEELCGGAALAERLPGAAIGVRPEDVRVDGFGLPVRICAVDYLGSESVLRMIHGEQTLFAKTDGGQRYQPGERLYVRWAPTAVHRFNADGVRIEA